MFLIHGVYHWRPKPVEFRNDYCIRCRSERVAIRVRTIDVWHAFWIPLLPVGVYRRWQCLTCGADPTLARTARRSIKIVLALVMTLIAVMLLVDPSSARPGEEVGLWLGRLAVLVLTAAAWWWVARGSEDVERRERLLHVQPSRTTECPLCHVPLLLTEPARCVQCGVTRVRLPDRADVS